MKGTRKKKTRVGRPPLPKSQLRSVKVFFRVTPALHKALVAAAKRQDKPLGKYINDTLEQAVKGDR